jgi:sulfoxide reductase catalytic subunit YedY
MSKDENSDLTYADVTPKSVYLNRREVLRAMGMAAAVGLGGKLLSGAIAPKTAVAAGTKLNIASRSAFSTTEKPTSYQDVTHYNNYYEFGTDKGDPAKNANTLRTSPWTVSIEGEVKKPMKVSMDDILKIAPLEERIYRHRCVETWSIVVPWIGYSFSALANLVQPTEKAKFVAFETLFDKSQMPQARYGGIDFPYVEGLRLDEAMNPLALLCVGMYGETLTNQDGAPVRMVVPWKYGYKSIKSLVKIRFVKDQPPTTWNLYSANEYGFYSNVNPEVEHPRWSQATERRLGEIFKRKTLMFNGYSDQVASLYAGMDLKKFH